MIKLALAVLLFLVILRFGLMMIRGLARPVPQPPPPGDLRKVKLDYRCDICGAELRMKLAANEDPVAPRHCMEDMDLVARPDE